MTFGNQRVTDYCIVFQLTSSRRGWQESLCSIHVVVYFNSHPHEEDDGNCCINEMNLEIFQLTSSRRGWPFTSLSWFYNKVFQLTSSRRGWLLFAYEATVLPIFQLTSSRRGWRYCRNCLCYTDTFQLTSSRRGWPFAGTTCPLPMSISTHILTKRMTAFFLLIQVMDHHFNSHPHEEDDSFY